MGYWQLGWEPQVAVLQLPVVGSLWLPRVEREGQPELPAHNQRITPCATRALPGSDDARRKGAPLTLGTAHVMYIYYPCEHHGQDARSPPTLAASCRRCPWILMSACW